MKKTTSLFCAFAFALGLCSTAQAFIITFNDEQSIGEATSYFYWTYECNVATKTATLIKGEQLFGDVEIKNLIVISDATTTNLYTVNKIAAGALANNPALLSVTVPNTILEIGDEAFKDCTSLAEVTLTHGVRYIGKRPFVNTIVTEINLPDSVLDVGGNITAGTLFTTTINIEDSSHFVYSDDGVLYNKDQTKLYACPARAEGTVSIPNTVTNIAADAFFGCFRLTYLNLPKTVNTIGSGAFNVAGIWPDLSAPESTPKLKSVFYNGSVPDAADDIYDGAPDDLISYVFSDDWADPWKDRKVTRITGTNLPVLEFKDAYGLTWHYRIINGEAELYNNGEAVIYPTSIDGNRNTATRGTHLLLPSSINGYVVTKIGDYAFLNCKNLSRIDIPPSITTIGDYAFKGCAAISIIRGTDSGGEDATIEIPDNITTLGYHPFEDLKSVAVIIPRTTIETKGNPIAGMPFIATVEIDENNPKFISSDNVIYNKQLTEVVAVPANYSSSSIHFLNSTQKINCEALYGCENLRSILLPESLEYIGTNAFAKCASISALTIPATVTEIGHSPFTNCIDLLKVTYDGNAPATDNALYAGTQNQLTSFVLDTATGFSSVIWKDRPIVVISTSPDSTILHYDDGAITWYFRVNDDVAEIYRDDGNPAVVSDDPNSPILSISLPQTLGGYIVKGVGDGALANLRGITLISIPDTYEWIGDGAFSNCTSLATVTLGNSLRTIGRHPFNGTNIGAVSIPASVSAIDDNVIYGCNPAVTVSVASGNQYFALSDDEALYDKDFTTLYSVPMTTKNLAVPATTTNINDDAFADCIRLASIAFAGNAPAAADDIFADTPATLTISVLDGSLGWDGDPTSSTLPASGLWRDRKIERAPGEATKYTDSTGTEWDATIYDNKAELGANGATPVIPASTSGEVTVPGEITIDDKTYAITAIPDGAFEGCSEITSINIPASITSIAADAFNGCTSLESFSVDSKNPAYSSRNGILYSKDGKTLVNVPAKTSFAATFTEQETATKKDIVEVIGSTDPTTMTTDPNQIIELKSYGTSTTTTTTEFFPAVSIDKILSGVTAISDYAFTDCGLMPEGSTVSGTMVVKVNGKETGRKTGTFELPVGTDSTGGHTNSYIYSQAGFYKGSVCLYHTASDSDRTVSYAIPINITTGISYGNLAFYNSHFTSKNKSNASAPVPPLVVIDPPVDVPDDDSCDTNDGFGVTAILRDSNGNESAIKEGEVIEAHVGIKMSIPLSVGNAPDGSLSTVTAKGLPAGVKLAKTAVKEGRKVVKYIYAIEGTPSRAQSAKTVVLKVTNKKNKLNESVSFAIKVLAMPSWVGGKYNGVCFDGTTEIGSATATISAAGKLSGKIMVPSDDGKKALKLSYTAKGFSGFDEESNTFYGTATMRVNGQTVEVPFTLSAYDGAGQLSLELPGMTAALEQNTWKRGDIVATTIEVDGFKFKLAANGKVKWSGSVEGDNGSTLSVSGSTQLLSGPSALVYIPPKANLVGGWCQLFQLW